MNKKDLIAAAKAQWVQTEASVAKAAKGNWEGRPADGGWSAADCYRHVIDTVHKLPEAIDSVIHDRPIMGIRPGDEEGLTAFKALTARTLPVELNTAHGILGMALHKLSDADLEKTVDLGTMKATAGELLQMVMIGHEQSHSEQALKAAGVA